MKKILPLLMFVSFVLLFGCTKEEPAETQKQEPATAGTQELAPDEAKRPNVLLVMVDDMGWTDVGCFGS